MRAMFELAGLIRASCALSAAQRHHLAGSETCAIGDAESRLVLQAGARCRFE